MIITFSGIDCAGKSTQIEQLEQYLVSQGLRIRKMWYRPGYSPEMERLKALYCRLRGVQRAQKRVSVPGGGASSLSLKNAAWLASAALDMAAQWGAKLRYWEKQCDVVICDRYIDDALYDFRFRFPGIPCFGLAFDVFRLAFPRPELSFLMMISHQEMLERMAQKQEPFPDPPEIRDKRYEVYRQLADTGRYTIIDAGHSVDEVFAEIVQHVEKAMGND